MSHEDDTPGLCGDVRPHGGGSGAARRYRAVDRGGARLHHSMGRRSSSAAARSSATAWGSPRGPAAEVADTVITNALILDHWGIVKADIGIKGGRISGIGKAGNPDIQPGVGIVIGAATEIIAGEGMLITAGGIDSHIHFICPQQIEEALMSGVTTMIGGGTGPATGTNATTCTPGPWHLAAMLKAADAFPMNLGFLGKGNVSLPGPLREQVLAGAMGLKLHEDWGTTPAAIDNCLAVADELGRPGGDPHRYPQRVGLRRDDARRLQGPHHPHLPHRRGRRRPCPGHHQGGGAAQCPAQLHQSDPPLHRQHHRRAPGHAHGVPSPGLAPSPRTSPSPSRASAGRPSPPRTYSTTSGPSP